VGMDAAEIAHMARGWGERIAGIQA